MARYDLQRPSARRLLKHPFVNRSHRDVDLSLLVRRYNIFKERAQARGDPGMDIATIKSVYDATLGSDAGWDFGTVTAGGVPSGTVRMGPGAGVGAVGDEYEEDDLKAERERLEKITVNDGNVSERGSKYGLACVVLIVNPVLILAKHSSRTKPWTALQFSS